jgi:hypothetical protein
MNSHVVERRFFFHANAVALAGHVRRPEEFFIPAVASSCLPVTGGIGKADAEAAVFGDLLSYSGASTSVSGNFVDTDTAKAVDFSHGNHGDNTLATATSAEASVTGLKMTSGGRVLEIEKLETKMSAFSDRRKTTEFRTLSAEFQGVRIDGVGLKVATHCDIFTEYSTKQKLANEFAANKDFRARYAPCFFSPRPANSRIRRIPEIDGVVYGTVVTNLEWEGGHHPDAVISGNSIKVPEFGSVHFGEILIEEGFRRLTLLRFQLGSPQGGVGSGPEVQTNGSTWPPQGF